MNTINIINRNRAAEILEGFGYVKATANYLHEIKLVEDEDYTLFFYYGDGSSFYTEIDCEEIPFEFENVMDEESSEWTLKIVD